MSIVAHLTNIRVPHYQGTSLTVIVYWTVLNELEGCKRRTDTEPEGF